MLVHVLEPVKDIVFKHVGTHVNKHVQTTVLGSVVLIVEVDVSRSVVKDVQDVLHVQDHVKDKPQEKVAVQDVELKQVAHQIVSMIVIRIVWVGDVDLFVV